MNEQSSSTSAVVINAQAAPELQSYDEMCNAGIGDVYNETNIRNTVRLEGDYQDALLPSIDMLQPLSIHLECSNVAVAPITTSDSNTNDTNNDSLDDVEKILKAIRKEFNEEEDVDEGGEAIDIREYSSNEDDDDEQEPKRQRFNYNIEAGEEVSATGQATSEIGIDDENNRQQWQPRRRLLRGRRIPRDNQSNRAPGAAASGLSANLNQHPTDFFEPTSNASDLTTATESSMPLGGEEATNAIAPSTEENAHFLTSSTGNVMQVPEGIDPSFLAALPEEMREEVIAEHMR